MTQPRNRAPKGNGTKCPHCGARCFTLKTDQLSVSVREITYLCTNEACGHQFVAHLAAVRTITPSRLSAPAAPTHRTTPLPPPAPADAGRS